MCPGTCVVNSAILRIYPQLQHSMSDYKSLLLFPLNHLSGAVRTTGQRSESTLINACCEPVEKPPIQYH